MKTVAEVRSPVVRFLSDRAALGAPAWLGETFHFIDAQSEPGSGVKVSASRDATLVSVCVMNAADLAPEAFERATIAAYATIREHVEKKNPVRFWNHIPGIHGVMDSERDRYMVFNAGRFRAFEEWYGSAEAFSKRVATASGVGHVGRDLVVHCLAVNEPGNAVENPRQVAAYRYSRRYGPLPPCFARATKVSHADQRLLLVGGTASIRGEDSIHVQSLSLQLDETFENLATLVAAAGGAVIEGPAATQLAKYRHLRVYYRREKDLIAVRDAVMQACSRLASTEFVQAELCRQELLVEIEGLAQL